MCVSCNYLGIVIWAEPVIAAGRMGGGGGECISAGGKLITARGFSIPMRKTKTYRRTTVLHEKGRYCYLSPRLNEDDSMSKHCVANIPKSHEKQ